MSTSRMFLIGNNFISEEVRILTPCPENKISKAFSGLLYSLYTGDDYDKLWSAGHNDEGVVVLEKINQHYNN